VGKQAVCMVEPRIVLAWLVPGSIVEERSVSLSVRLYDNCSNGLSLDRALVQCFVESLSSD
jgi:hypothetical protein